MRLGDAVSFSKPVKGSLKEFYADFLYPFCGSYSARFCNVTIIFVVFVFSQSFGPKFY